MQLRQAGLIKCGRKKTANSRSYSREVTRKLFRLQQSRDGRFYSASSFARPIITLKSVRALAIIISYMLIILQLIFLQIRNYIPSDVTINIYTN